MATSVADTAVVNPNSIKSIFANGLSTFSIKSKQLFSNCPSSLPRDSPNSTILDS